MKAEELSCEFDRQLWSLLIFFLFMSRLQAISGKMVRSKEEVVRPNEKMVRPNEPAHKASLLGSKRNYVPPQLLERGRGQRRNNIEDWYSSSESIHEDNNDDELHSSEDEDMHIQPRNENFDSHDHEADENIIEHDNVNEMEISRTIQEDVNVEGAGSSSTKKNVNEKKRGGNKCKEIAKRNPNEKLEITFYNNRAVGTNHKVFARYLAIIVRDTNICPVRARKWDDIGEKEKEHMWTAVTDVFINESMDTYKEHVLRQMRELWTNWRSDLLRYNVTKKKTTLKAAYNGDPPKGLDDMDWKWLIKEVYLDGNFKKRSARNSDNRSHYAKELMH